MSLRHHLRPDQDSTVGAREPCQRFTHGPLRASRVGIEADPLELGDASRQLGLQPLRTCADSRELDRPALGACLRHALRVPAVMAVEASVSVQRQGYITRSAAARYAAGTTVHRRCDAPTVEKQDRLPALLGDLPELPKQRCRQRIPSLVTEIHEADARHRRTDPGTELHPLESSPALGPWGRAPEDGDSALEDGPLGRHRARVVARIGLLLVGRVVLLVDDDHADVTHRGEQR